MMKSRLLRKLVCGVTRAFAAGGSVVFVALLGSAAWADASSKVPPELRESGELLIVTDAPYPPFEFFNAQNEIDGLDIELARAVAKKLNLKVTFQDVAFDGIIPGLQSGKYSLAWSAMDDTKEREKVVDFIDYFKQTVGLLVRRGNPKDVTLGTACGHKIAAQRGSVSLTELLPAMNAKCKGNGQPEITIQAYPSAPDATLAVESDRSDALLELAPLVAYTVRENPNFEIARAVSEGPSYVYYETLTGIAFPKSSDLKPAIQTALQEIKADGTYDRILKKWKLLSGALETFPINGASAAD